MFAMRLVELVPTSGYFEEHLGVHAPGTAPLGGPFYGHAGAL